MCGSIQCIRSKETSLTRPSRFDTSINSRSRLSGVFDFPWWAVDYTAYFFYCLITGIIIHNYLICLAEIRWLFNMNIHLPDEWVCFFQFHSTFHLGYQKQIYNLPIDCVIDTLHQQLCPPTKQADLTHHLLLGKASLFSYQFTGILQNIQADLQMLIGW